MLHSPKELTMATPAPVIPGTNLPRQFDVLEPPIEQRRGTSFHIYADIAIPEGSPEDTAAKVRAYMISPDFRRAFANDVVGAKYPGYGSNFERNPFPVRAGEDQNDRNARIVSMRAACQLVRPL